MDGAAQQFKFLAYDLRWMANYRWMRIPAMVFDQGMWAVLLYRIDRAGWLALGRTWTVLRVLLTPLWALGMSLTNCSIHYKADIGPGIRIAHPNLGVVVSGYAVIGRHIYITGGNTIGSKPRRDGPIVLGDGCVLGANACVIGPLTLADKVTVGAGAVAVKDCLVPGTKLHGVPALPAHS